MGLIFSIVMCVCLLPVLLIMFFILYPKNWKKSKLIFGVTSRKEYTEGETGDTVTGIVQKRRSQAVKVLIASFVLAGVLILIRSVILQTTCWMLLTYASLIGIALPFVIGNKEMKSLKKSLGLGTEKKETLIDIKNVGAIRTLKFSSVLPPNVLGFLVLICALLIDLKVIQANTVFEGTFLSTGLTALFLIVEFIITSAAYIMDGLKNEVISTDSDINANYNRAKKKNLTDFTVKFLWIHAIFLAGVLVFNILFYSEIVMMAIVLGYLVMLILGMLAFVRRDRKIESRYINEMTVTEDEDDYWIGGLLYYNPKNKRFNIKKRMGLGSTINMAHPVGKIVAAVIVLILIFCYGSMVYVGMAEATPIKMSIEDNTLICHHLSNDYEIEIDSIESITYDENIDSLTFAKVAGFGMPNLLKGSFSVNGENGCKVFLNPENGNYIKLVSKGVTYYLGAATAKETKTIYETLVK